MLFGLLLPLIIGACFRPHLIVSEMNCDKLHAQEITDSMVEKHIDLNVADMEVQINEDSLYFIIEYLPKNKLTLGNGAKFKVLKSTCTVEESKYYQ